MWEKTFHVLTHTYKPPKWSLSRPPHPLLECFGGIEFPCCQLSCRLPKWEAKTRHGVSFVLAFLKILEEDLKQQPVYQDSPKDYLSGLSLEIDLAIQFAPNQDLQDIPQQLQLDEVVHYHPSE
ncbi:uncharacterized protein TNCV_4935851 [Trichonephila clavipes]|nr:uncharacterized protein TNCV_4935851 [Trichonephila clavipes]